MRKRTCRGRCPTLFLLRIPILVKRWLAVSTLLHAKRDLGGLLDEARTSISWRRASRRIRVVRWNLLVPIALWVDRGEIDRWQVDALEACLRLSVLDLHSVEHAAEVGLDELGRFC